MKVKNLEFLNTCIHLGLHFPTPQKYSFVTSKFLFTVDTKVCEDVDSWLPPSLLGVLFRCREDSSKVTLAGADSS